MISLYGNVPLFPFLYQQRLKDVDKLLKLDPGNTKLLAQKQKLLADGLEMRFLSKERHIL